MASTTNDKLPLRQTPWFTTNFSPLTSFTTIDGVCISFTKTIPAAYHWVPIYGMTPERALDCLDAFIRFYRYRLALHPPLNWDARDTRMASIVLGVSRAVMTNTHGLLDKDINEQKLAKPLLSVTFPPPTAQGVKPAPQYTVLVSNNNSDQIDQLTRDVAFTDDELELVRVVKRSALTIIPIQGYNLITEGHHYLPETKKQSYKAFLAVERQLWVSKAMKDMVDQNRTLLRDLIWHKAGYPVAVSIKEFVAINPTTKLDLVAANLGSAAARLPAMETDIRVADTYVKLGEAVDKVWATMGGSLNVEGLRYRLVVVKSMPRGIENLPAPVDMRNGVIVTTRSAALLALNDTVAKNADIVAQAFGFYVAMVEAEDADPYANNLRAAHCLNRLRRKKVGHFMLGLEIYKDYKAMQNAARRNGEVARP